MTKEQMEELANLVTEKLWEKLEEEAEQSTEKFGEMAELETMLSILEQSEKYEVKHMGSNRVLIRLKVS